MPRESSSAARFERLLNLKTFPGFGGMSNENVVSISEGAVERRFAAGEELYGETAVGQFLYYIIDGKVAVQRRGSTEIVLGARSVVGGLSALAGGVAQRAVALEDTLAYEVRVAKLLDLFEDNFDMMLGVLHGIAQAFIEARRRAGPKAGFAEDFERKPPPPPMSLVDRLFYLHESLAFARTRISSLTELATWAVELREPAGAVLWRQGESSGHFLLILSGVIRCQAGEQSFRLGAGGAAGTLSSISREPRWYTATVEEDLVALRLDTEQLLDIFEDHADMGMDLLAALSRGLLDLRDRIAVGESARADAP